ncbi:hypothetical protein BT96DRAFT_998675 [Gymnopus androsaceus JB14]|uniref:Uncharacterized protein n=1 Tax=Gymnopus androsaceus JB14 TaxID=1447944 RepID=A0A6A4HB07_9AGAR|nr:hypothetical protein BT96DRAFT_998675 [Gymnopus androsaceus JB14]
MAPRTRRSLRKETPSASTTTNTTNPSPAFSTNASVAEDSPVTTDIEQVEQVKATKTVRSSNKRGNKRAAPSDDEEEEEEGTDEEDEIKRAPKRRAVAKRMYVEVNVSKKVANKGKGKTVLKAPITKGKGKAKADPTPALSGDDIDSEAGLEYDENRSLIDSQSSGSEFVASESEGEDSLHDSDDEPSRPQKPARPSPAKQRKVVDEPIYGSDEDQDAIMLEAAMQLSRQTGRNTNGAGSSSGATSTLINTEAARRAAAIESRLAALSQNGFDVDDSAMGFEDLSSLSSDPDEEPLPKKSKKKVKKSKAKPKKGKKADQSNPILSVRELKREERELRRKLGRKLTWAEKSTIALHKHHPELKSVWGDLEANIKVVKPAESQQPANIKLTLLPFQRESLHWMKKQEEGVWKGGMLADEMGMGKTIQVIALLVSDRKKPNLVIAPTVAIMQWRNEIEAHTDGMKVLVWHGSSRETNVSELKKHDVVLTTYAILESVFRKQESGFKRQGKMIKEKSPIHQIVWNRVILDEAHNIKDRASNTAKSAFELQAISRWCLSGTPLQNRVGELYSLIRFLGGDPFSYYFCKRCDCKSLHWKFSDKKSCDDCGHSPMQHTCFWNNEILTPIQKDGMEGPGKIAFKKLKVLLDRMMLRRTKLQRADDLGLPPRTVIVRNDYFSPEEKELYLSLFSDAKRQFGTYLDQGTVLNNSLGCAKWLAIPDLVIRSKTNANKFQSEDVGEATVCRICNDIAEDAIQSKCRHIFDRECIKQYLNTAIEQTPSCPVCFVPLTIDLEAPALDLEQNLPSARQGILGRLNLDTWRSSTKIEALVEELSNLRSQDATTKSIVFSQFVNFLDLIAYRLQKAGFTICRLEGTMSPQARDATIKHFMTNVEVTVFLVSLKAGGVALNLTEASRVYLMDSWWNPAVEFQAMDRIHRLGQHRPVKAIKLVVEDSIESRIVQLQEKKSAMVDATLSPDDAAMGRLTPEDLQFLFRTKVFSCSVVAVELELGANDAAVA